MDFTELIRKANLAKKEIENTRNIANEIKTKLIENGAEIEENAKFEELPNIISESNLGNSKWKRPKKWLDMPNIIMEESKYIPLIMRQLQQQAPQSLDTNSFSESFRSFLTITDGENLSEITTHVDGNNFYVSANDMAYVMLCDISKNSNDNIITFEGANLAGFFPFTDINMAYTNNNKTPFLSDLFIQIDDETPLNLSELSRGNITLPTSGKYKNISIIDKESSCNGIIPGSANNIEVMEASSNSLVEDVINTNASEYNAPLISFMVKLDYGDFSDNTLIDNKKQCIIKVWCNNFNYILPTFGVNNNPFLTKYNIRNIRKINSCIREISICENEYTYFNNLIIPSYDLLLYGIGENVNKMNIFNSFISSERIKNTEMSVLSKMTNIYYNNLSNRRYYNTDMGRPENQMDLKEIDLSNSKYYDGFIALTNILLNSPLLRDTSFCEITRKLENVEKITFPNFKENFDTSQDSNTIIGNFDNFFVINSNNVYYANGGKYRYATPLCMNLALFKKINKETIIDLINKLPIINKNFSEISMKNIVNINRDTRPKSLSLNEQSNIFYNAEIDKKYFKGNTDMIKEFVEKINYTKCILDFSIISEKDTTLEPSSDNSQITVLDNNPAISTLADFMGRDGKIFYTLLIPNNVYDLLTEEEKNMSIEKGWKIITGYNYPVNEGAQED